MFIMNVEIIKVICAFVGGATGLFFAVRQISIAYINRHKNKEIKLKKGENGNFELYLKGHSISETANLL